MKIKPVFLSTVLALSMCFNMALAQKILSGVTLPANITLGKDKLILNGGGIREKYFMDMYVGGLYLQKKNTDAQKIIDANESMLIRLHIVSSLITSEKMRTAITEGFDKSTKGNTKPLKNQIDLFIASFKEEIVKGDVFELQYTVESGVSVYKNGKLKTSIAGLDFKKALFGIWLCNNPADEDLKEGLLGG